MHQQIIEAIRAESKWLACPGARQFQHEQADELRESDFLYDIGLISIIGGRFS